MDAQASLKECTPSRASQLNCDLSLNHKPQANSAAILHFARNLYTTDCPCTPETLAALARTLSATRRTSHLSSRPACSSQGKIQQLVSPVARFPRPRSLHPILLKLCSHSLLAALLDQARSAGRMSRMLDRALGLRSD